MEFDLFFRPYVCLSISHSLYLSIHLSVHQFVCASIHPSIHMCVSLFFYPSYKSFGSSLSASLFLFLSFSLSLSFKSLCNAILGVSIAFRDVWNQLLIKLPGTVIPNRAPYKFEVRARRGTVKLLTKKRAEEVPRQRTSSVCEP